MVLAQRAFVSGAPVATLAAVASIAAAESNTSPPPGGPAPKALVGTYTTKLTRADRLRMPRPDLSATSPRWKLVILNSPVGAARRAIGLAPLVSGGPAIPFGVRGNRFYLQCMSGGGLPTRGYSTYTWSLKERTLRFKLVKQPCKSSDDRNQPIVLTSEPWRKR